MARKKVSSIVGESIDFSAFSTKVPWHKRASLIEEQFPSVTAVDWHRVFSQDPGVLGRLVNDIIRLDEAERQEGVRRRGKRPVVNLRDANEALTRLEDLDYSDYDFYRSIEFLKGNRSIRHFASKTGINKSKIQRYLERRTKPSIEDMEKIAAAFNKHPSFFVEYRIAYVMGVISEIMSRYSDASIVPYKKISEMAR